MTDVNRLEEILSFLPNLLPEGIIALGILIITMLTLIRNVPWELLRIVTILTIAASVVFSIESGSEAVSDFFSVQQWRRSWILLIDISSVLILFYRFGRHIRTRGAEQLVLMLMLLIGGHFLILSTNLFMVYLSVEILSLSGYMMVALPVSKNSIRSGFKYLVFGAVSSAIMLYGMSLYFGLNDSLSISIAPVESPLGNVAVIMITFGLLFKISAVPFHLWVPDVYQGTSHPVLALLAIVPKLSAFAFLTTWVGLIPEVVYVMGGLAIATLVAGNFGALMQSNIRRLMGFSAVGHTGIMLMAFVNIESTREYLMFYAVVYALMTVGVFHLLNHYYQSYGYDTLDEFAGKGRISRGKSVYMVIWMIALTGLPPTAGFTSKLLLFTGVGVVYGNTQNVFILAVLIIGIVTAVVSLAYYIKLPYSMIFRRSDLSKINREKILSGTNLLATLLVFMVLLLFIKPEWLMSWLNSINFDL